MKEIEIILSLIGTVIGMTITILGFLVKMIKNGKAKKKCEQVISISNAILPFIQEAEKFTKFSGEEKKAYVLTKVNQFAQSNGIQFIEEQVSDEIEQLISLTKKVNYKENKKPKETEIKEITAIKSWL